MKTHLILFLIFISISICYSQQNSTKYFPLEIGNRWDYNIDVHINGGIFYTDTFSVSIQDTLTLKGKKYFKFSSYLPLLYNPAQYFRTENNKVYVFNEQDSSDCFTFRFDLPPDTSYIDCQGIDYYVINSDTIPLWGNMDIQQDQSYYRFSENYGIYQGFIGGIVERNYTLKGCIISGIEYGELLVSVEEAKKIPLSYKLEQNYPNPFNPTTTIEFSIPSDNNVEIKIFNVLGMEVATLLNGYKQTGKYKLEFNVRSLSSGIYFYQIVAGKYSEIKKMVLLK